MKRIFLMIYFAMAVLCGIHAQHFEFMGIPIDGSIEAFDAKLKAKGFVSSKDFGIENTKTEKWYDGRFAGDDVVLSVYSTRTNIVYSTNVSQYFETLDDVKAKWEYYVSVIEDNYKNKIVNKKIQGTDDIRYEMELGDIVIKYIKSDYKDYKYRILLMYFDRLNTTINNEMNKEDI